MKRQRNKAFVSNPLANATGRQYEKSGKTLTLDTSKLRQALNTPQKPYKPVQCGIYKLPKYFLPDVETAVPFVRGKNKVEDIMNIFKKYPSLDYVSAYHFSTKDSEVNKEVWKKFTELYDQGYIKRIYDKINGYFASGLPNYVKKHSQSEIDSYFKIIKDDTTIHINEVISEEIVPNVGFKDYPDRHTILKNLIYDFVTKPESLFEAMYENAKQQLLTEARKISLSIAKVSDKEDGAYFAKEDGSLLMAAIVHPARVKMGNLLDSSLFFNWGIHKDAEKENAKQILYSVALKDNLTQLQVSTKSISQSENEDYREEGEYPQGRNEDDSDSGNNGKNSDKTMLLLGVGILAAIFFIKRNKR